MVKKYLFKKTILSSMMAAMLLVPVGCGKKNDLKSAANNYSYETNLSMTQAATEASFENYDVGGEEYYTEDMPEEEFYDEAESNGMSDTSRAADSGNTTTTLPTLDAEKLIYRCSVRFDTLDYKSSITNLKKLINDNNAFIENENEYTSGGHGTTPVLYNYSATIRVPSENYQTFLDNSGSIGELLNKSQNVTNLTQEYNDLGAELEVLETKRSSYLEMMKEAKTLDDMESLLMIDERLTEVEVSINRIKTRMNSINNDVAYSYIDITIAEVREYEEPVPETFGERISQAFKNGWADFKNACQNFVIWAAENVIGLSILIVCVVLFWLLVLRKPVKRLRASLKAKKAARKAANAAAASAAASEAISTESSDVASTEAAEESNDKKNK